LPFYLPEGVAFVIFFYDFWDVDICSTFPYVIAFGVALPLDEVLEVF
jgi:hypothetical protein